MTMKVVFDIPAVTFGDFTITPSTVLERTRLEDLLFNPATLETSVSFSADIKVDECVHFSGDFTMGASINTVADIATGISSDVTDLFNTFGFEISDVETSTFSFAASDVRAFVGATLIPFFHALKNRATSASFVGFYPRANH